MDRHYEPFVSISLKRAVREVVNTCEEEGIPIIASLVCYNIAAHSEPHLLNTEQAELFIYKMKQLIAAHYMQVKVRP